jgi:uncharacterized protein YkwD
MGEGALKLAVRLFLLGVGIIASGLPAVTPAAAVWEPNVTAVSPVLGQTDGNTPVKVRGYGFLGATHVFFGALPVPAVVLSDNEILTRTPPGAEGVVQVRVATPVGTSPEAGMHDDFRYHLQPRISGVSPDYEFDTGGGPMTISGSGFRGVTSVMVGRAVASFTVASDGTINAILPHQAAGDPGLVDVVVSNRWAKSVPLLFDSQDDFRYYGTPHIDDITPREGPSGGGFKVWITGSGFTDATTVYFGSVEVEPTVDAVGKQIVVEAPANDVGTVKVTVGNPAGIGPARSDSRDTIGWFDERAVEDSLLAKINDYRASKSKNRLTKSDALADGARDWSAQMAQEGVSAHDPSAWCPAEFRRCAELVQSEPYDGYPTAAAFLNQVFQAFKSSADHNAIMLQAFSHGGAGLFFDHGGYVYLAVRFGQT